MKSAREEKKGSEQVISRVLRSGVTTSLVLLSLGTVISFLTASGYRAGPGEIARLTGEAGTFPRSIPWFIGGLIHLDGQAVIALGLLVLIATPVVRVAVSLAAFARERDRTYVIITGTVLLLLILSFALGKTG
jgi:uncharacterized membrane protein